MNAAHDWPQRAAIAGAALLTFARSLPYPLQESWDDGRFISHNPDVQHASLPALMRMFTQVQFEAYHPLHLLSYWLDVPWAAGNPLTIHAVSLGLWILALLVVYALLRALQLSPWTAVAATLIYGLHPVQIEAVAWASGRKDILAALLGAASLWAHVRARSTWDAAAWAARALYCLALLAKTSAIALPLVALSLDVFARGVPLRNATLRQLPSLVLAFATGYLVLRIWGAHTMLRTTLGGPELAPMRFVQTLGHQLLTAVWPARTAPMYATQSISSLSWARTTAVALYALACVVAYRKRLGLVFSGLLAFALCMLPVSNIVPLYFSLQDRYLSLPLLGLSIAAGGLLQKVAETTRTVPARRTGVTLIAAAIMSALALRTWQYAGAWHDEARLWGHAVSAQPDADYAWLKLGEVRRDRGELEGAIAAYRGAIHVAPLRKLAHATLFEAVALRDERRAGRQPSLARNFAQRYYEQLGQPEALREFARMLLSRGYARAAELPLQAAQAYAPWPDAVLERAAHVALREDRASIARCYASMMTRPPAAEPLRRLLAQDYFPVLP